MDNTNTKPTKKEDEKKSKKQTNKKKSASSIDKASLIFYAILLIGIIAFVIIMIRNHNRQHYVAYFGEDIKATIDLKDDDRFILSIYADSDTPSKQEGKYKKVESTTTTTEKSSDKASSTDSKVSMYSVEFEDKTTAEFLIDEDKGILTFITAKYKIEFKKGD